MPTYEYECAGCGRNFELFQKITDTAIDKCPKCRSSKVRRLISAGVGIIFKGKGFYATDYRKDTRTADKPKTEAPGSCPAAANPGCAGCSHNR